MIESPPPWLWLCHGRLWQRVGPPAPWLLPLELLQQLHGWLIVPLRRGLRNKRWNESLPLGLRLRASWLNSYRPGELAWWWAAGVCSWNDLSCRTPDSVANPLHRQRRQSWPGQCRPALELLSDKAALLALTPQAWRAPFLTLEPHTAAGTPPAWWRDALHGEGVVLKPLRGHAGRGVVRFRLGEHGLNQEGLFRQLGRTAPAWPAGASADPRAVHQHWQRITGQQETALASPYLLHSSRLPVARPSVVVRVITQQTAPGGPIQRAMAWLEIPLSGAAVLFLGVDGRPLPSPGEPFTAEQHEQLQHWQAQIKGSGRPAVEACLEAAAAMHALLPPIDQVAWDWIPADPEPQLLEGNGGFGLLVPQLFQKISNNETPMCLSDADRPQS